MFRRAFRKSTAPRRGVGEAWRFVAAALVGAAALSASCSKPPETAGREQKPKAPFQIHLSGATASAAQTVSFAVRAKPFSPTLGNLFANGRLVIIPNYASVAGIEADNVEGYAFSAVGGYGGIYHFFQSSKWAMADIEPLPVELPQDGWQVAWSNQNRALELIVTAPGDGRDAVTLYRLADRVWKNVPTQGAPHAAKKSFCVQEPNSGAWFFLGDDRMTSTGLARLDGAAWDSLPAPSPEAPSDIREIIAYPPLVGLALLTGQSEIWLWSQSVWSKELTLPPKKYTLFHYDPSMGRIVVGAADGIGKTVIRSIRLERGQSAFEVEDPSVTVCDLVSVNDESEGVWNGLGRVNTLPTATEDANSSGTVSSYTPGVKGKGKLALAIETRQGGASWAADEIDTIEFAPQLDSLYQDRGAFVPSMSGYVEVSSDPSSVEVVNDAKFPFLAHDDSITSELQTLDARSTMRLRHSRFWRFEGEGIEWVAPYPEIHPDLDHMSLQPNPQDGSMDSLSWSYPEPGLFQYEYFRRSPAKVQWTRSPVLTLRLLPEASWQQGESFWMLDPVTIGSPPVMVQAGWVGNLVKDENGELYKEIPTRGFIARAAALSPDEWSSAVLPIPFGVGVRLLADPAQGDLYLLGGRVATKKSTAQRQAFSMEPNPEVWLSRGEGWERIETEGPAPKLDGSFAAVFDPFRQRIFVLSTEGLFSLREKRWTALWEPGGGGDPPFSGEPGLFVHPASGQLLAAWVGPQTALALWQEKGWGWIRDPLPTAIKSTNDIIPLAVGDSWAVADSELLSALRAPTKPHGSFAQQPYGWRLRFEPAGESKD